MSISSPMTRVRSSRSGFSILELLAAVGILAFLMLGAFSLFQYFWTKSITVQNETSARLDEAILERVLFEDLVSLSPSLGSMKKADANNQEFFDYYYGLPISKLPVAERTRQLVLDVATGGGSLEFVVGAGRDSQTRYFPVAKAYDAVADFFTAGPLTYIGVNRGQFFNTNYPNQWKEGEYFLFYAPTLVRMPLAPLMSPARPYSFLGYVKNNQIIMDTLGGLWKTDHPLYPGVTIGSIDEFFRWLPAIGGAMSAVLVAPVKVVRYRLVPDPVDPKGGSLYRSSRNGTNYPTEILYAKDLRRIAFKRTDVTTRLIEFNLELNLKGK